MPMYGMFSTPILGMLAQTSAFSAVSQNITNMNTGGYKALDTTFSTVLASTYSNNSDIGGLTATTRNFIEQQGQIVSSTNNLDLAISGRGFYVLNTEQDGSGDTLYTRDGSFVVKADEETTDTSGNTINPGYLVDKNGYYLQGWEADSADGSITSSSALTSLRVDTEAFAQGGAASAVATADASLAVNFPATAVQGDSYTTTASVFDSDGDTISFEIDWTKNQATQEWTAAVTQQNSTSTSVDGTVTTTTTITPTTSSLSTSTFTFDSSGGLADGTSTTVSFSYTKSASAYDAVANSTTVTNTTPSASFDLDLTDTTSIGDEFLYFDFQSDGRTSGELSNFSFNEAGEITGLFSNGLSQALYKLPLAVFADANSLDRLQGNLFQESVESGTAELLEVRAEGDENFYEIASFVPYANENSNVNLQNEFTNMIMSQQAYNSAATVFKTVDEMTQQAANLKT